MCAAMPRTARPRARSRPCAAGADFDAERASSAIAQAQRIASRVRRGGQQAVADEFHLAAAMASARRATS
jgi:hypothetical protein